MFQQREVSYSLLLGNSSFSRGFIRFSMYVHNLVAGVPAYFPRWSFRGATNNARPASIIVPRRRKRSRERYRLSPELANFYPAFPANETRASAPRMVATFYISLTKYWKSRWNGKWEFQRGWERRLKEDRVGGKDREKKLRRNRRYQKLMKWRRWEKKNQIVG